MTLNIHRINPDKAKDCLIRGDLKAKSGDLNGALSALRECFEHQPNNIEAYTLAVRIYLKAKDAKKATEILKELHRFNPPNENTLLLKAKAELLQSKNKECMGTLEEIFAIRRDHDAALEVLADLLMKEKKYTESISIYERLLEKDTSNRDLLYSLAVAFYELDEWDEVIHYCAAMVESGGNHPAIQALYDKALHNKKDIVLDKQGKTSILQRIYMALFDPITEKELRIHSDTERQMKRASKKSYTDANTGALNYRAMVDYVPGFLMTSTKDVFLAQMDIDFFKAFNDLYSHQVGDEVLRAIAVAGKVFFPDRFFRKGGEEFVWVYEGVESDAMAKAEEWRKHIENHIPEDVNARIAKNALKDKSGQLFVVDRPITISQGIVKYRKGGDSLDAMLQVADHNLYESKQNGRNAVSYEGKVVSRGNGPRKPILDSR